MRLTNYHRQAYVRSVMAEVPVVDHKEEICALLPSVMLQQLPQNIQNLYEDPLIRPYLIKGFTSIDVANVGNTRESGIKLDRGRSSNYNFFSYECPMTPSTFANTSVNRSLNPWAPTVKISPDLLRLRSLLKAHIENGEIRYDLESKIKGIAMTYTTVKTLAEALPEFEKYLPREGESSGRTVPVVSGVISEFVQAGWRPGGVNARQGSK